MAYDPSNFSSTAYCNGWTRWHYKTNDSATEVLRLGYFNDASSMLRVGDEVVINTSIRCIAADRVGADLTAVVKEVKPGVTVACAWSC